MIAFTYYGIEVRRCGLSYYANLGGEADRFVGMTRREATEKLRAYVATTATVTGQDRKMRPRKSGGAS